LEGGSQSTPGEFIDWLLDVVDACARVLAPHGSLVFELGDTYSGSGGAGGDYAENGLREGQPVFKQTSGWHRGTREGRAEGAAYRKEGTAAASVNGGRGWPLAKSLSLIPESFRWAMVYGHNPFTGRQTEPWRLRNVIRWVRPNPPVGALGDKFRPATSELMVFCKAKDRYFDLDSVRVPGGPYHPGVREWDRNDHNGIADSGTGLANPAGAPPLDWWNVPLLDGDEETRYGPKPVPPKVNRDKVMYTAPDRNDGNGAERYTGAHPGGAPPLDWWEIPPGGYPGSHYAVFPPELCVKPIKAMTPERVCRTCGEPSRRIVRTANATDERQALADYLRERREASGVSVKALAAHFPSVSGGMTGCVWNWENAANVPTVEQWPILKRLLTLDDRFDDLVTGERAWTESEIEYRDVSDYPSGWTQDGNGKVYQRLDSRKDRIAPDRFSDCGHDDWRPGMVLDCFVGSGTTLAVATGHGRDAIGIDLDSRNFDLALDRVGPFILTRGEIE